MVQDLGHFAVKPGHSRMWVLQNVSRLTTTSSRTPLLPEGCLVEAAVIVQLYQDVCLQHQRLKDLDLPLESGGLEVRVGFRVQGLGVRVGVKICGVTCRSWASGPGLNR